MRYSHCPQTPALSQGTGQSPTWDWSPPRRHQAWHTHHGRRRDPWTRVGHTGSRWSCQSNTAARSCNALLRPSPRTVRGGMRRLPRPATECPWSDAGLAITAPTVMATTSAPTVTPVTSRLLAKTQLKQSYCGIHVTALPTNIWGAYERTGRSNSSTVLCANCLNCTASTPGNCFHYNWATGIAVEILPV